MTGYESGSINEQGEEQKKLDVVTNDLLKRALAFTGMVGVIASEEEDAPVFNADAYQGPRVPGGAGESRLGLANVGRKYVTVFDPLDGSSNVDANIPTGTIFGVYEEAEAMENCELGDGSNSVEANCLLNTLQPGTSLVASGYCLYSSSCMFVFTLGAGTHGFTYDRSIGEFVLTHPDIKIPKRGKIYSINEANRWNWDKPLQEYVTALQTAQCETKMQYSSRYIGSMVGDVHRTLLYGGILGYPADTKNVNGKLRLLYEAVPMSFLIEQVSFSLAVRRVRALALPLLLALLHVFAISKTQTHCCSIAPVYFPPPFFPRLLTKCVFFCCLALYIFSAFSPSFLDACSLPSSLSLLFSFYRLAVYPSLEKIESWTSSPSMYTSECPFSRAPLTMLWR